MISFSGMTKSLDEWAIYYKVDRAVLIQRLDRGIPLLEALTLDQPDGGPREPWLLPEGTVQVMFVGTDRVDSKRQVPSAKTNPEGRTFITFHAHTEEGEVVLTGAPAPRTAKEYLRTLIPRAKGTAIMRALPTPVSEGESCLIES